MRRVQPAGWCSCAVQLCVAPVIVGQRIALSAARASLTPDVCACHERDLISIERQTDAAVCEIYGLCQRDISLTEGGVT